MIVPPPHHAFDVAIGTSIRPIAGEQVAGDGFAAVPWSGGMLVAVVDGLGHGERAAVAASAFLDAVRADPETPLGRTFERAHHALIKTRGAVAAVARFESERQRVEIASLGNVVAFIVRYGSRRAIHPIALPGVLGSTFRPVRPQPFDFDVGDTMVMHSDGVRTRFELGEIAGMPPQEAANEIMNVAGKTSDDACCVVARGVRRPTTLAPPTQSTPPPRTNGRVESQRIPLRIPGDAACAATETRAFAQRAGLETRAQWEVSIAASELATNVLKFAGGGTLEIRHVLSPRRAVVIEVTDHGGGIGDVTAAVTDGWSEGGPLTPERAAAARGLGVGLGSVHRMMDDVNIQTEPGHGTRIVATKFAR